LTNVKVGDPAELRIDEYPGQLIHGKVVEIAPASGSQFGSVAARQRHRQLSQRSCSVFRSKIALEDSTFATKLRPGISVIATVRTRRWS